MTKDKAIERLENDCCKSRLYCELYPDACMKEECEIYMAIEALKERPTGKWLIEKTLFDNYDYRCSCCGWYECHTYPDVEPYNFCPNCGADMKGSGE